MSLFHSLDEPYTVQKVREWVRLLENRQQIGAYPFYPYWMIARDLRLSEKDTKDLRPFVDEYLEIVTDGKIMLAHNNYESWHLTNRVNASDAKVGRGHIRNAEKQLDQIIKWAKLEHSSAEHKLLAVFAESKGKDLIALEDYLTTQIENADES